VVGEGSREMEDVVGKSDDFGEQFVAMQVSFSLTSYEAVVISIGCTRHRLNGPQKLQEHL